jgi:hypothetical protein
MYQNSNPTPPGFNKQCRDACKGLLTVTLICLFLGRHVPAIVASAGAILLSKEGTVWSSKNIKWGILSVTSFGVTLSSWMLLEASQSVDEDKAYTLRIILWLGSQFLRVGWSTILGLFLFSAFSSSLPPGRPPAHLY